MKNLIALVFSVSFSVAANAAWVEGKITNIQLNSNSGDAVILKWTGSQAVSCGSNQISVKAANLAGGQGMFDRSYAGLLTAIATQKPARFDLVGCDGNSMKATSVQICATDPCIP